MNEFKVDKLKLKVMPNRDEMGKVAAGDIYEKIKCDAKPKKNKNIK